MIHTLTLNPAIDRTYLLPELRAETVSRASEVVDAASGKGVNVLRVAATLGAAVRATVLLGGPLGGYFRALCEPDWSIDVIPIEQNTRMNVSLLIEDTQQGFKVNENGPELSDTEVQAVLVYLDQRLEPGDWLAICGSTPNGVSEQIFLAIRDLARERNVRVALDVPNLSLARLLAIRPSVFKPNLEEFERMTGPKHATLRDLVVSVRRFATASKIDYVIVTLGALGAVISHQDQGLYVPISEPAVVHPVGAGDALLAGFLTGISRNESWCDAFALGVAASYTLATGAFNGGLSAAKVEQLATSLRPQLVAPGNDAQAIRL